MQFSEIIVKRRATTGKNAAYRTRATGATPAVFYGGGEETVPMELNPIVFRKLMAGEYGYNAVLKLKMEGEDWSNTVLVREVQQHPVKDYFYHVDFIKVDEDTKVKVEVPVKLKGKAPGVAAGGTLKQQQRTLKIGCRVADIPKAVEVDVSSLTLGQTILANTLTPPPNTELLYRQNFAIATVLRPKGVDEMGEEGVEGEAGEGTAAEAAATSETQA